MGSRHRCLGWGATVALGLLGAVAAEARASGFQLAEQSARGLGNAFAGGAAVADDPSTVYFNPAGMSRVDGTQVSGNVSFIFSSGKWQDDGSRDAFGSPLTGGDGSDGGVFAPIPTLYATYTIDERWTAGFALNVPYGLATDWESTWKGRYQAIETQLQTINLQPSIAYRIDDHWSVGVGVDYQYISARLTQAVDYGTVAVAALGPTDAGALGLSPQGNDGRAIVEGDDWSWGFNVGAMWEMNENTRFGVHYRSKIEHRMTGDGKFTIPQKAKPLQAGGAFVDTDMVAKLTLPEVINVSGVHQIDERWTVMGDVQWTRWSRIQSIDIDYLNAAQPTASLVTKWDDTFRLAAGAEYAYSDTVTLRFGLAYDRDPTKRQTRSPRVPTDDHYWLSMGFTYQPQENLWLDFGYAHIWLQDGHIDQTGAFGERVVGKSETKFDVFAIGATMKF